jgi:hypothetical protein
VNVPATEVTRADIEAKLREIGGEASSVGERAAVPLLAVGAAAVVGLLGLAYLVGRRRGRKQRTVVEIKRA